MKISATSSDSAPNTRTKHCRLELPTKTQYETFGCAQLTSRGTSHCYKGLYNHAHYKHTENPICWKSHSGSKIFFCDFDLLPDNSTDRLLDLGRFDVLTSGARKWNV